MAVLGDPAFFGLLHILCSHDSLATTSDKYTVCSNGADTSKGITDISSSDS